MLGLAAALIGCSTDRIPLPEESLQAEAEAKKKASEATRSVRSEGGRVDVLSDDADRSKEYSISWGSATLEYTSDQKFGGHMKNVKGLAYKAGADASSFEAAEAFADKGSNRIRLVGGVKVTSIKHNGTLYCDEVVFDGTSETYEAKGGIRAEYKDYLLSGLDHVIASADLDVVATPDMFKKNP